MDAHRPSEAAPVKTSRRIFRLTLRALPGEAPAEVRLRRALKVLLRAFRFRAERVEDLGEGEPRGPPADGPKPGTRRRLRCANFHRGPIEKEKENGEKDDDTGSNAPDPARQLDSLPGSVLPGDLPGSEVSWEAPQPGERAPFPCAG